MSSWRDWENCSSVFCSLQVYPRSDCLSIRCRLTSGRFRHRLAGIAHIQTWFVTRLVSKHYCKPSMTSCMHAHTSSYIYVTCQMTEKTFSHLLFTSDSLKLILFWRACSALNPHAWFIRFQLAESAAYDTAHHMDAHSCHKWSKPSWNFLP